tara:strand:- start:462 stop:770 length:309 start_codon:yes stop_codon:yes gene_type:complete
MIEFSLAFSYHLFGEAYDLNYIHPHVRYESESSIIAGAYYNSEYRTSIYLGKKLNDHIEVAFVTGYNDTIVPYVRINYDNFFVSPAVYPDSVGAVIGYEVKL